MISKLHKQVKTKYGFYVDEKMVKIVEILNDIPGVVTIESCQRFGNGNAWVCFKFGESFRDLCNFAFDKLYLRMNEKFGDGIGYLQVSGTTNGKLIVHLNIRSIKLMEEFLLDFAKNIEDFNQ